jgi:NADH dehydrogenase
LARSSVDLAVTLVNPRSEFVERIRLHQYVAGNHHAVTDLRLVVPESTKLLIGTADRIDPDNGRIHLADTTVEYDHLIYAVGSREWTGGIDGAAAHAFTLGTFEEAQATRTRLRDLPDRSSIVVIGGGLTGIETAAELAGMGTGATIHLITDTQLAPSVGNRARNYIRRHLTAAGVVITEGTAVRRVNPDDVVLATGTTIASDLTILSAGAIQPDLARASNLPTSPTGAMTVGPNLVSEGAPNIVAAGDAALIPGSPLRMSCQAATPSGIHAAETVLRVIEGREPKRLKPKFTGQAISLGRTSGVLQGSNLKDRPRGWAILTGPPAAYAKEKVCSNTLRFGHFGKLSYSWS